MADFDKDDYLRDLPDPDGFGGDAGSSAGGSEAGGRRTGKAPDSKAPGAKESARAKHSAPAGFAASAETDEPGSTKPATGASDVHGGPSGESSTKAGRGESGSTKESTKPEAADAGRSSALDDVDAADDDTLTPLGQAKKDAAEYLEALQRERAEFINFRNRASKEQERFRQHGIIDVLTALLPALDDIDRIREHSEMDDSFKAVSGKIDKAFAKFGVEKFGEKGEEFDPTRHEAVLHRPDEKATKETVDAVVEAGYRIGDRVIRAARVVVVSPKS